MKGATRALRLQPRAPDQPLWWMTGIRVGVLLTVLVPGILLLHPVVGPSGTAFMASILAVGILFSVLFLLLARAGVSTRELIWAEIFLDLVLITFLIHITGGSSSDMPLLFLLPIVYAGYFDELKGSLFVALLSTLLLGFFTVAESNGWIQPFITYRPSLIGDVTLKFYLYALLFFTVGVASGYAASVYHRTEAALTRTRRDLNRAQISLETVVENMTSALLAVDESGEVLFLNRSAKRILGLDSYQGKITADVLRAELPEFYEKLQQLLHSHPVKRESMECSVPSRNRRIEIGFNTTFLRDAWGNKLGMIMVFQDLARIREAERNQRTLDRLAAIGEFSANLAHEIRTPVTAIKGAADLLAEEGLDQDQRTLVSLIRRESDRLNRIVTDFLKFTKLPPAQKTKVSLHQVLHDVVERFRSTNRRVQVHLSVPPEDLTLETDPTLLFQALSNLVQNAVQAIEHAQLTGEVRITAVYPGKEFSVLGNGRDTADDYTLVLLIEDNGPGIPSQDLERIFDPFYTTRPSGSGMGLPLVKKILQRLGGRMEIYSREREGTQVILYLPVS